jgi:hypothetical protein
VSLHWPGTMRVNTDVLVRRVAPDELVATSREPATRNEYLWIQLPGADPADTVRVRVADSQPIVVDGAVRYLLRLRVLGAAAEEIERDVERDSDTRGTTVV